jgi:hypothetical protein
VLDRLQLHRELVFQLLDTEQLRVQQLCIPAITQRIRGVRAENPDSLMTMIFSAFEAGW